MAYYPPTYQDARYGLNADQLFTIRVLRGQSAWRTRLWQYSSSRPSREDRAPFIYKYLTFDPDVHLDIKKASDAICAGQLWLSNLDSLNDVDEVRGEIEFSKDAVAIRKWADDHAKAMVKSLPRRDRRRRRDAMVRQVMMSIAGGTNGLEEAFRRNIANYGVHCFSVDPRVHSMWGLYAGGQSGICLQFERGKCPGVLTLTHRVNYRDEPVRLTWPADKDRVVELLFTKPKGWVHEAEVRYVSNAVSQQTLPFDARALTGIILGRRFEESSSRLEALYALLSQRSAMGLPLPKLYRNKSRRGTYRGMICRARDLETLAGEVSPAGAP